MGAVILGNPINNRVTNYTTQVNEWVHEALSGSGVLDDITYSASLLLLPTEQGPQPAWGVLVSMTNPLVGQQPVSNMAIIGGSTPPKDAVLAASAQALSTVVDQRSQVLST